MTRASFGDMTDRRTRLETGHPPAQTDVALTHLHPTRRANTNATAAPSEVTVRTWFHTVQLDA